MRRVLRNFLVLLVSLSLLLVAGSMVSAEPVAPLSNYSKKGMGLIRQQNKTLDDLKKEIPSRETVGIPIYPGATFASSLSGQGLPPTVNLISNDPPDQVKAWYMKNLDGWGYSQMLNLFYDGRTEPKLAKLFAGKYQTVAIMEEEGKALDLMLLDVPNVKTRIQIVYKPKK